MNRLIFSAAVAGALLTASAIPSLANTVNEGTDPASFSTIDIVKEQSTPQTLTDVYDFSLTTVDDFDLAGILQNLSSFSGTLQGGSVNDSISEASFTTDFNVLLGPGSYALTLTAMTDTFTPPPPTLIPNTGYSGTATLTAAPIPGTLVLFAGGLAFLGFWGWSKGHRTGSSWLRSA